jgi:hypothetical protein
MTDSRYERQNLLEVSSLTPFTLTTLVDPLQRFIWALRKECPHFRFGVRSANRTIRVQVYVEDETYVRGWIGYQNYNDTGGEDKYGVWSKQIMNNRYGYGSYQQHLTTSKTLKAMVKAAKGFLDRVTTSDVHQAHRYLVEKTIDSKTYKFKSEVSEAERELGIIGHTDIGKGVLNELIMLYDSGHQFLDSELPAKIQAVKDARGDQQDNPTNKQAVLVWKDGTKVRTAPVDVSNYSIPKTLPDEQVYATPEMLPPEILSKISILQVAENETYLMDTGMRFGETLFYVQV